MARDYRSSNRVVVASCPLVEAQVRRHSIWIVIAAVVLCSSATRSQTARRYSGADGRVRVALAQQPYSPTAVVPGPRTMAEGGVQQQLAALGATVRVGAAALSADENTEYGGWKRLGMRWMLRCLPPSCP